MAQAVVRQAAAPLPALGSAPVGNQGGPGGPPTNYANLSASLHTAATEAGNLANTVQQQHPQTIWNALVNINNTLQTIMQNRIDDKFDTSVRCASWSFGSSSIVGGNWSWKIVWRTWLHEF